MRNSIKLFLVFILSFTTYLSAGSFSQKPDELPICFKPRLGHSVLQSYLTNLHKGFDYLRREEVSSSLNNLKRLRKITNLLVDIRKKEQDFPDHYQLVTAQDSRFFAYQVIAKELHEQLHGVMYSDFQFLRYPNNVLCKSREGLFGLYPSLNVTKEQTAEILAIAKKKAKKEQDDDEEDSDLYSVNDTLPEISRQVLAVNLSMETCIPLDSALFVFMDGKGVVDGHKGLDQHEYLNIFGNFIRQIFQGAGISPETYELYIPTLIYNAPVTKEGIINQIFLPKERIQDFLYMSTPGGFLDLEKDEKIHNVFSTYQKDRLSPRFEIDKNIQGRLIAGTLFDHDVKIFRYTLIPIHDQENYVLLVKEIVKQILNVHSNKEDLCIK